MSSIAERREALQQIFREGQALMEALKEECPHLEYIATYDGDTGNWCRDDDCYWVVLECQHCGKRHTAYSELAGGGRNDLYYQHNKGLNVVTTQRWGN